MTDLEVVRAQPGGSLREISWVLFRHIRKAIFCFAAVVALVSLGTFAWPPTYRSDAKLLLRIGRESVTLDPTASTGKVVSVHQLRETEINSELEILSSEELAERVVDALGPALISPPGLLARLGLGSAEGPREKAVRRLMDHLNIEVLKDSNIIKISCRAGDPGLAQKVVSKVIDEYFDRHIAAHRTAGSFEFFSGEAKRLSASLAETEDRLRNLKNKTNVGSLEEQRRLVLGRLGSMQQQIEETHSNISASAAKLGAMRTMLSELPQTLVTQQTSGFPNSAADGMRVRLYELRLKEQDLLTRYSEGSAPVRDIRTQIAQAEDLLKHEGLERTQVTQGINDAHQKLKGEALSEEAALLALRAKSKAIERELGRAKEELRSLNNTEVKMAEIERHLATQRGSYQKYSDDLEQARIDRALETERISNISIIQPATFVSIPVSPRTTLNIILGLVLGIFAALGLVFMSEYLDHSITKPSEVEARLQVPNLIAIPRLPPERIRGLFKTVDREVVWRAAMQGAALPEGSSAALVPVRVDPHFQALRDHLAFVANGHLEAPSVLAVTSCGEGAGVTTVATALASVLGREAGGHVLMLDLTSLRGTVQQGHVSLRAHEIGPAGAPLPRDLWDYESMTPAEVLSALKSKYTHLVLDLPPVLEATAVARVCGLANGVVLVVEAEKTRWEVAQKAKAVLNRANANLLGVVLNKRRYHVPEWLYRRL